ncbi:Glycosyltransferase involved in cell wall bisynthesis [Gillisia sp. Hel1_33_143]|nr:Glycosyltransferase involved in cell wall bisynthesis [Gillisia sp. Hel1_33_143]
MSRPLISIITVNFNDLEGLKRTFKSVFNQTWKEFEYIVIDGGSNDGSAELISSQGSSINYWISEPDSGIYNAMNKGIGAANGEYLLFLNSGDELINSEILSNNYFQLKGKDVYYYNKNIYQASNNYIRDMPSELTFSFLYSDSLAHQSTFIKKTLFEEIGLYDENLKIVSDWKFFIIAFYKFNASFEYVNNIITVFYLGGASSDKALMMKERSEVITSDFSRIHEDFKNYKALERKLNKLRSSLKIKIMINLGLLNKF